MKLPLSWLRRHVDLDLPTDELVELMSLRGLEVEAVTSPGAGTAGVRTARVLHHAPHPDADRLRVVRVTGDGGDGEVELVCGAANFDVGDVVAHAVPGSTIPGMTMEARPIRGVVSNGMLASARELELGDDHDGILVLDERTPLGVDLREIVPIGEPVIEIAVQPDRGDHLSVLGVARDLAAILDTRWHGPQVPDPVAGATVPVALETSHCERFATWALEDVQVQPSPLWLQQRLAQCGVRSIDVVVDVTNLVMLELGQPLHAFDLDRLHGPSLTVRDAAAGETLVTLDDRERRLDAGDVLIADAERPVSLAGVMGGLDTEVTAETTRVLIEAAVWDPLRIRATSRRLGLVSEASQRYERRVDPEGAARAAARAAGLLQELAGARATGTDLVINEQPNDWSSRPTIRVEPARVSALLGLELDPTRQRHLLERAGAEVADDADALLVTPPSWRGDLNRPADVAEEVARLHGYDAIPATLPNHGVTGGLTEAQRAEREARRVALAAGFHEALTRPFVGDDALAGLVPSEGRVVLGNPLAKDASAMRPTLLEGLLQALRRNSGQGRQGTALVEMGRIFRPADDPLGAVLDATIDGAWRWLDPDGAELPIQPRTLGLAAQGVRVGPGWLAEDERWSVYDLLAVVDEVVRRIAPDDDERWQLERRHVERPGLHPGRTAALVLRDAEIGVVGQLHPTEADRRDLPEPVVVAELLLEPFLVALAAHGRTPARAPTIVRHPAVTIDVALAAPDEVTYGQLADAVRAGAGELLDDLWFFDEYRGAQVGEGARSIAIRVRLQAPDRQLTDADADQAIERIAAEAERRGASLRR